MMWLSDAAWWFLTRLSTAFLFAGLRLKILSYKIEEWIWPFNLMAEPLRAVGSYLDEAEDEILGFRNDLAHYRDFLNDLWDGSGLNTLIARIFWEWKTFTRDPKEYLSSKMNELIKEWPLLISQPKYWLLHRIYEYDPDVWNWLVYPVASFKLWLSDAYPDFYRLMIEGWQGLVALIDMVSAEAYKLITDPVGYIRALFVDSLGWSMWFWQDPWGYLFANIMNYMDRSIHVWSRMLAKTGERIIRYMWEGRI